MRTPIHVSTSNTRIHDVCAELLEGNIRIPEFQRDYCWSNENVDALIDSASRGWPLGNAFLVDARGFLLDVPLKDKMTTRHHQNYHLLIDGAQRLETIYRLFVSLERIWLVDVRTERSFSASLEDSIKICNDDPFVFNYSRHQGAYHRTSSRWEGCVPEKDLEKIPTEWLEPYGRYQMNFYDRLIASSVSHWNIELFVEGKNLPKGPSMKSSHPGRWSKDVERQMTRAEHKAKLDAYNAQLVSYEKEKDQWNEQYGETFAKWQALLEELGKPWAEVLSRIDRLDDAYLGFTVLRQDYKNKLKPKELVEYFRRYNMAGVPVDVSFLDKLADSVKEQ